MNEKKLVILIVILTAVIMIIFSCKVFKRKNYCSKCKKNKNK
jgi:hypothetical protein